MSVTLPGTGVPVATYTENGEEVQILTLNDVCVALMSAIERISNPLFVDPATGRLRVLIDPLGGAQTLGTITTIGSITTLPTLANVTTVGTVTTVTGVTTVATLTNQAQIGGIRADSLIMDAMQTAWANSTLPGIAVT